MSINDKKGINLTSGFKYVGGQPLDVRLVAEDESDLQSLVDNGATYNGMVVWVNSTSKRMVFNGSEFIEDVSPDTIGNINDVLEQINGGGTSSGGGSSSGGTSVSNVIRLDSLAQDILSLYLGTNPVSTRSLTEEEIEVFNQFIFNENLTTIYSSKEGIADCVLVKSLYAAPNTLTEGSDALEFTCNIAEYFIDILVYLSGSTKGIIMTKQHRGEAGSGSSEQKIVDITSIVLNHNLDVGEFELTDDEVALINSIDEHTLVKMNLESMTYCYSRPSCISDTWGNFNIKCLLRFEICLFGALTTYALQFTTRSNDDGSDTGIKIMVVGIYVQTQS